MAEYPEQMPPAPQGAVESAVYVHVVEGYPNAIQLDSPSFVLIELFGRVDGCECGQHTENHVNVYVGGLRMDVTTPAASLADLFSGLGATLSVRAALENGELD